MYIDFQWSCRTRKREKRTTRLLRSREELLLALSGLQSKDCRESFVCKWFYSQQGQGQRGLLLFSMKCSTCHESRCRRTAVWSTGRQDIKHPTLINVHAGLKGASALPDVCLVYVIAVLTWAFFLLAGSHLPVCIQISAQVTFKVLLSFVVTHFYQQHSKLCNYMRCRRVLCRRARSVYLNASQTNKNIFPIFKILINKYMLMIISYTYFLKAQIIPKSLFQLSNGKSQFICKYIQNTKLKGWKGLIKFCPMDKTKPRVSFWKPSSYPSNVNPHLKYQCNA